ncbi:MAG: hypothetical protein WBA41_23845 [Rivularia sp. (in: cyanobacteria)]
MRGCSRISTSCCVTTRQLSYCKNGESTWRCRFPSRQSGEPEGECKIRIAWWGQFEKDDLDIDDLILRGKRHSITYISIDEWMKLWSDDIRNYLLYKSVQFNTSDWSAPVQHPYRSDNGYWKKVNTEWKWIRYSRI